MVWSHPRSSSRLIATSGRSLARSDRAVVLLDKPSTHSCSAIRARSIFHSAPSPSLDDPSGSTSLGLGRELARVTWTSRSLSLSTVQPSRDGEEGRSNRYSLHQLRRGSRTSLGSVRHALLLALLVRVQLARVLRAVEGVSTCTEKVEKQGRGRTRMFCGSIWRLISRRSCTVPGPSSVSTYGCEREKGASAASREGRDGSARTSTAMRTSERFDSESESSPSCRSQRLRAHVAQLVVSTDTWSSG